MKILRMAAVAVMAGSALGAGPERAVTVCMDRGDNQAYASRQLVSKIFVKIGVNIEWHDDDATCKSVCGKIAIRLARESDEDVHPNALAYALPFEATHIVVFYDRVHKRAPGQAKTTRLLAYVLAHEITHILQGINRHSETGIMKARWAGRDDFDMQTGALAFTPEDIDLIQIGLDRRQAGRMVANLNPSPVVTP